MKDRQFLDMQPKKTRTNQETWEQKLHNFQNRIQEDRAGRNWKSEREDFYESPKINGCAILLFALLTLMYVAHLASLLIGKYAL